MSEGDRPADATAGTHFSGACDCHMHIYDDRFPAAAAATLRPANASIGDYRGVQKRI